MRLLKAVHFWQSLIHDDSIQYRKADPGLRIYCIESTQPNEESNKKKV